MDRTGIVATLFGRPRALIGMIHAGALPGTPRHEAPLERLIETALGEGRALAAAGFHALILENMNDRPYVKGAVGPETIAAMTAIARELRRVVRLPLGIQILAAANREALAVAQAAGAAFIRAEGFVYGHVADEGWIESGAAELLRYRRTIGAQEIRVFADVKKKHSAHAITADVGLAETARAAEFFLADGVVVSGTSTGVPTDPAEIGEVSAAIGIPTLVGSGITPDNLARYAAADALIVGSALKRGGVWTNALDPDRVAAVASAFEAKAAR